MVNLYPQLSPQILLMVGFNRYLFHLGQRGMPLYMLHRSMLLGKRLPLDPPLEHEGRIHKKRLSIMKVCLWLCIYLCLLVLILISCRINGLNYCFFNASPATCSPFVLAPARTGTVSKRSFCSWERGPKAHPYAFGFRVKNRVGETCQALG